LEVTFRDAHYPAQHYRHLILINMATRGNFFQRLATGLEKTRTRLFGEAAGLFKGRRELAAALLEELENQLLGADVGVQATAVIRAELEAACKRAPGGQPELLPVLRQVLVALLKPCEQALRIPDNKPFVILVVGVNGVGKTTTIAKLARQLQQQRHSVLLAAGDTFRAAAIDQLQHWGERLGAPVIAQQPGADAGAVLYNALQAAVARHTDVVIADTAGRLHNKDNLMEELKKIHRVIHKFDARIEVETLLVVDAGTGMNALVQAQEFQQAVPVTGIALTKLDGTAKGGMALALAQQLALPIRYLGVGEGVDDLQPFNADDFVRALLDLPE
ncbi:MAG: signal recognition particle-docking protein FtsY, partial [Gammaproteobacteria bacterium]|nr:signal recognition particle-docking protein FtsY [Gammaproteobacteria bacterium]MCY4339419.1 signal recognition particle-docking protein FtsY [Gammaproteobacteria bacterium]